MIEVSYKEDLVRGHSKEILNGFNKLKENKNISEYLVPVKSKRLQDIIAENLKKLIFSEKIKKGEKLPTERELAENMNVSRVVIKQALMNLEQSGFIEKKRGPKGGSFVSYKPYKPITNYIKDLIVKGNLNWEYYVEARKVIEVFNVKKAVSNATSEKIVYLRYINEQIKQNLEKSTAKDWKSKKLNKNFYDLNAKFHIAIANMSENQLMRDVTRSIMENLFVCLVDQKKTIFTRDQKEFTYKLYNRHSRIIDSIEKKKEKESIELIIEDIDPYNLKDKKLIKK